MSKKLPSKLKASGQWFTIVFFVHSHLKEDSYTLSLNDLLDYAPRFNQTFKSWYFILHDKDTENGKKKPPHFHFIFQTTHTITMKSAIEYFARCIYWDDYLSFEKDKGYSWDNVSPRITFDVVHNPVGAVRYLCHLDDLDKFPYDNGLVYTNNSLYFDYCFNADKSLSDANSLFDICESCNYQVQAVIRVIGLEAFRRYYHAVYEICRGPHY